MVFALRRQELGNGVLVLGAAIEVVGVDQREYGLDRRGRELGEPSREYLHRGAVIAAHLVRRGGLQSLGDRTRVKVAPRQRLTVSGERARRTRNRSEMSPVITMACSAAATTL